MDAIRIQVGHARGGVGAAAAGVVSVPVRWVAGRVDDHGRVLSQQRDQFGEGLASLVRYCGGQWPRITAQGQVIELPFGVAQQQDRRLV
jgi:hypothetical protein